MPDIHFINRSSAISVGDNGIILQPTDTGYNWVTLKSPTNQSLRKIFLFDSTQGLMGGNYGTIVSTTFDPPNELKRETIL